jgi:uncharacterized protein YciI
MQFLVIGRDADDADAPARRARVRPAHLDFIQPLVERGRILVGGAMLDGSGTMIGSTLLAEFDKREDLDEWLGSDPYVKERVWRTIEVHPFRCAVGAWMPPS